MNHLERPLLRGIDVRHVVKVGEPMLQLFNRQGLSNLCLEIPQAFGLVIQFFNGERTVDEIVDAVREDSGIQIPPELVRSLVEQLDSVCVLDGPKYDASLRAAISNYRSSGVRPPACAGGAYRAEPDQLRQQLGRIFEHPNGAGRPNGNGTKDDVRGIFAPHIDFTRGGPSFGWAFRALVERTTADVFVIVATSHYSPERFTLTRNHFSTPLGLARTDRDYVDSLASIYGVDEVYRDELAQLPEHSIEFEVLLLQYLLEGKRDFTIVPLLVGPMQDAVEDATDPNSLDDIARMIEALREVEATSGKNVCYVVSGDLAHIGPKFGDSWMIDSDKAKWNLDTDKLLLSSMETAKAENLFEFIAGEGDERRICGFPPAYVMLSASQPGSGKLLYHDQYVDPKGNEIVSFASMVFEK